MIVIAHNIRSLHNVGAIFRSAAAFGAERLYLTGFTGIPPRAEIAKVSLGAEDRVPWRQLPDVADAIREARDAGHVVLALDNAPGARPIAPAEGKVAIVLGNELEGVAAEVRSLCDGTVEIPMRGSKRSLNVSVAAGIAMFVYSSESA